MKDFNKPDFVFNKSPLLMCDYLASSELDQKLKKYYGVSSERELLDILASDFYYLPVRDISQNEGFMSCYKKKLMTDEKHRRCSLGILWNRGAYNSKFSVDESIDAPLKNAVSVKDILQYNYPKAEDFDFSALIRHAEENSDRITIGGLWTGIMGDSYRLYGFERFLTDIAMEPEIVHTLIDRLTEMYLSLNDKYFSQLNKSLDIWFFGNDFGSQMGMLMSEDMWYEFFYDNIKSLCQLAHSYGKKVMMHSCGGIAPIIPHLISAGVDILDPIQTTAKGMEPRVLEESFGGKIVFHGGVDTQQLLPFGTPEQVETESTSLIEIFSKNNSYIFAPSQILSKDVPCENVDAMYKAYKAYKKYRYSGTD